MKSNSSLGRTGHAAGLLTLAALIVSFSATAADRLPATLDSAGQTAPESGKRVWTIPDLVEIRHITDIAISDRSHEVAFVVKQPLMDSGQITYGLYVVQPHGTIARKVIEASYIDQLSWHPGTDLWSARVDLGSSIQLYDIDEAGSKHPLVVNPDTIVTGPYETMVDDSAIDGPRNTGIASYEWAPDGKTMWYSRYRLRSTSAREEVGNQGVVYDDHTMWPLAFYADTTAVLGTELHILNPDRNEDRTLVYVAAESGAASLLFQRGGTVWEADSQHILYSLRATKPGGDLDHSLLSVDVRSGETRRWPGASWSDVNQAIPSADGKGYLSVRLVGSDHHLFQIGWSGAVDKDFGAVAFSHIGKGNGLGSWQDPASRRFILGGIYEDREGLFVLPESPSGVALAKIPDSLSNCSFTSDLSYGACVRENLTLAPELVEVAANEGTVTTLVRVNAKYAQIEPLHTESAEWTNRYGNVNTGYITYPRNYVRGRRYPTIVVTHARDAGNRFAYDGFQWEFPIQVLAEQGYLVLSVNEPRANAKTPAFYAAFEPKPGSHGNSVAELQFGRAFNAIASMDAAMQGAIDKGIADPELTGIAGYSRGSELIEYLMTQSKLFHVAIEGDSTGWPAGVYFAGVAPFRVAYQRLYGGSPYDSRATKNYQRLSPSFRASQYAGPLLQMMKKMAGPSALEINTLLQDAGVPVEMVFFPHENHVFWHPNRRAAAMEHSIEWFDYWLRGIRVPDKKEQYDRWDAMAKIWKAKQTKNTRHNAASK